jgi:hypothetical protein
MPQPLSTPGKDNCEYWVGPKANLDRKSRPHRDSIPRPSSPQPVAIPTELPSPHKNVSHIYKTIQMDNQFALFRYRHQYPTPKFK